MSGAPQATPVERPPAREAGLGAEAHDSIESWLTMLGPLLRVSESERSSIKDELRDHLSARTRDLMLQGREETNAAAIAIRELGDAASVARQYRQEDTRTRRRTMLTYGAVGLAAVATVFSVTALTQDGRVSESVYHEAVAEREVPAQLARAAFEPGETTFGEALDALRESGDMELNVVWGSLDIEGLERDTPVTLVAETAQRAFTELIERASADERVELAWRFGAGGSVTLATQRYFDKEEMRLVSYDIAPLFEAGVEYETVRDAVLSLVEPDVWHANGGDLAQMLIVGDRVFVEAPERLHPKVRWILSESLGGAGRVEERAHRSGRGGPVAGPSGGMGRGASESEASRGAGLSGPSGRGAR